MLTAYILGCLVVTFSITRGLAVEDELEKFMRGALDSIAKETDPKAEEGNKMVYDTKEAKENSSQEVKTQVENIGNFTDGMSDDDNATSNVAKGEPAFGEGIGSGFHRHIPRGHNGRTFGQGHGIQGQNSYRGQRVIGSHVDARVQGQYPGFGSPEVHGDHIGGQGVRRNINQPQVPDGRMGLPRPDGCLCNGPILNPCCFELPKGVIRGQRDFIPGGQPPQGQFQQGQLPQGHHHHPDRQSGLKLPNGPEPNGHIMPPQTPIGLEYRGDFTCPVMNGNFPHPTDCSRFLQCAHSVPYDSPCPKGLLYDSTTGMCNWPDLVHCNTLTKTEFVNQGKCRLSFSSSFHSCPFFKIYPNLVMEYYPSIIRKLISRTFCSWGIGGFKNCLNAFLFQYTTQQCWFRPRGRSRGLNAAR